MATASEDWHLYQLYGLRVAINRPVRGLTASSGAPDVRVDLTGRWPDEVPDGPWAVGFHNSTDSRIGHRVWTLRQNGHLYHRIRLRYLPDVHAQFITDRTASRVWVVESEAVPLGDVVASLTGPISGCILRLRGISCFHASVVAVDDGALAFVGPKGTGKSTTAAALARGGHGVLADDIAVLAETEGSFLVQPGYSRLRLEPTAVHALYGSPEGLSPVRSFYEKRYVELTADPGARRWRFEPKASPLLAIYVLPAPGQAATVPVITSMSRAQGLMALAANSYVDYMVSPALRAREFALLGRLVQRVPVRRLERPEGLAALPDFCAMIQDDVRRMLHQR